MKLSVKSDYAARAVLSLARRFGDARALKIEEICAENGIPGNYLVQIMIDLKARQLVRSVRGKEGGYRLAKHPREITLGEVLRAIHGSIFDLSGLENSGCPEELSSAWRCFQSDVETAADKVTFEQLAHDPESRKSMYYI
ncbi:MAG: Rrf2 family transcriptional regulator [Verrucomicrobia bacterium]|nr:Rrf2 family transcriptional regulator [Verrucomicrobiota bacterium]